MPGGFRGGFAGGGFRGGMPVDQAGCGGGFRRVGWAGGRWAADAGPEDAGDGGGAGDGAFLLRLASVAGDGAGAGVAGRFGRLSSGRNIVCRGIGANPTKTIIRFIFNTLCIYVGDNGNSAIDGIHTFSPRSLFDYFADCQMIRWAHAASAS